ncbi:hypothetical protein DFQ01_112146 [Paenibacillus cellulosilyticus]|uniref:Uncharacterized protein n=1 Tax=Paenibacillus cellulosilyticus TaxID=375489 RepID=A0A2V2YRX1_9BACL|nr:hypothetical protein DFQ01_112146 [Paenibacillus cellulosilyticus]QKS45646.1 hypothetical protein HUB94_15285 [Paenibacillus cellulosilyticus]
MMAGNCFYLTIIGGYGLYSSILEKVVEIRKTVTRVICEKQEKLVDNLRKILVSKLIYEQIGTVVDDLFEISFSELLTRIVEKHNIPLSLHHEGSTIVFDEILTSLNCAITKPGKQSPA